MPEPTSPWGMADVLCDRLMAEFRSEVKTVFTAMADRKMPVREAAFLMDCIAKVEQGITNSKTVIAKWVDDEDGGWLTDASQRDLDVAPLAEDALNDLIDVIAEARGGLPEALIHAPQKISDEEGGLPLPVFLMAAARITDDRGKAVDLLDALGALFQSLGAEGKVLLAKALRTEEEQRRTTPSGDA